jgi:hypothetical protein
MEFRRAFSGSEELDALNDELQSVQDRLYAADLVEGSPEYFALSARFAELIKQGEVLTALRMRRSGPF